MKLTPKTSRAPETSAAGLGQHLLLAHRGDLPLGVAEPAEDARDPFGQLLGPHLQRLGELADHGVLAGEEVVGVGADQRLDAADAGADRRLAEQLDQAELARALRVRATAELAGPVADRDDAHRVAVLLAEQGHRARVAGLLLGHDLGVHRQVLEQQRVDLGLDVGQHRHRHRGLRVEVEPEPARARSPTPPAWRCRRAPRGSPCAPCASRCGPGEIARRRSMSTSACAAVPVLTSPDSTLARCTIRPLIGDCTSRTSTTAPPASSIRPPSASWPPPSA